ncbi:MAG TPA: LacI family DNA-binding transcriptional regulator [Lacibacter sp.]|nr:LacI family DNA-binding transcriptional regulator [Lacibacter sp.]HMO89212.1 LacI family DNA-binding transcriptional regulator [Lacibacter sp.]HMP86406.1 LacI family DNA-binding transcriptional regulator [Lacibacter sp.]
MKFEAVTIKDIAKALGLSTSTVSRALRDSYEISPETKKRVIEYAQQINYQPNPIALSLKERKSRSIGVIVCEIANSFFSQVINGIESIANERGYNIIIAQSLESASRELSDLQFLTSRSVDGIIMSVGSEVSDYAYLKELTEKGMPVVFFDRVVQDIQTHKVISGNYDGAYKATTYLIKKGYRNIAAIANAEGLSITRERIAGYCQALTDHGLPVQEAYIRHCLHSGRVTEEVDEAFRQIWKQKKKPDAIFAASDKLTTGCLRILKQRKLKVPDQVALIGFSNNDLTELLDPPLSIIKQPAFEMGVAATGLLLELIESKRPVTEFETKVLPAELIIRTSA